VPARRAGRASHRPCSCAVCAAAAGHRAAGAAGAAAAGAMAVDDPARAADLRARPPAVPTPTLLWLAAYIACLYCACRLPQSVLQRRRENDMQGMRLGWVPRRLPQPVLRRRHETVMQGVQLGWMTLVHAGRAGAGALRSCSAGRRCRAARGRTCIGCGPVLRCLLTRPPSWGCPEHCDRA